MGRLDNAGLNRRVLAETFQVDPKTLRWWGQALLSDLVQTVAGQPLYFETTDNSADLRERFFGVSARCRAALGWPPERVLTWVVDRPWPKDPRLRQIVVRATNPKGPTIEVAVLTDGDFSRSAIEILRLMFGRWIECNSALRATHRPNNPGTHQAPPRAA